MFFRILYNFYIYIVFHTIGSHKLHQITLFYNIKYTFTCVLTTTMSYCTHTTYTYKHSRNKFQRIKHKPATGKLV